MAGAKAARRRVADAEFTTRYFAGHGLDLGPGAEPLSLFVGLFPRITALDTADWPADVLERLEPIADESYDFVHGGRLEEMENCFAALGHWFRVLRPGGHLILTVPDEDMAEQGLFPSALAPARRWTFALYKRRSWSARSINLVNLAMTLGEPAEIQRLARIEAGFRPDLPPGDQTAHPIVEAAIELVVRKRPEAEVEAGGRLPHRPDAGP